MSNLINLKNIFYQVDKKYILKDIDYHINTEQFTQDLKISDTLKIGNHLIHGTFIYQVCDPIMCIPHWDDFSIQLQVNPGEADPKYIFPIQKRRNFLGWGASPPHSSYNINI